MVTGKHSMSSVTSSLLCLIHVNVDALKEIVVADIAGHSASGPSSQSPRGVEAEWAAFPLGVRGWTAGKEAVSAYLIRSRPSGRKINSRACCYCGASGRAFTRAQHNIYTAGETYTHSAAHLPADV